MPRPKRSKPKPVWCYVNHNGKPVGVSAIEWTGCEAVVEEMGRIVLYLPTKEVIHAKRKAK
jgi:hypothetical protein